MVGDHFEARGQHVGPEIVEADRGVWQVVKQDLHRGMEQRRPMLDARVPPAIRHRKIERVLRRAGAERLPPALAETGDARAVEGNLGDRAQRQAFDGAGATLRRGIEVAHAFDSVAE